MFWSFTLIKGMKLMQYLFLICSLFGQYVVIIVQRVLVKLFFFSEVQPLAFSSLIDFYFLKDFFFHAILSQGVALQFFT